MAPHSSTCPFELMDVNGSTFGCDLHVDHEGPHVCYCDDGESCDKSQPEPDWGDPHADYATDIVRWSVHWSESAG